MSRYILVTATFNPSMLEKPDLLPVPGADDAQPKSSPTPNEKYDYYNSAFLFDPDARYTATYHKQKLVIFGEYIPLIRWLPFIKYFTPITGGFTAGDRPGAFTLERRALPRQDSQLAAVL